MPCYKTHNRFNIALVLPVLVAAQIAIFKFQSQEVIIFAIAFIYTTLFANPDMDLASKIKLTSLRGFLSFPFRLYSKVFKHRGLSHHVLWGSLTRIMWIGAFFAFLMWFLGIKWQLFPANTLYIYIALFGIFSADIAHIALDYMAPK